MKKEVVKAEINFQNNTVKIMDLLHLVILNNLENINAELITKNIPQDQRLIQLNQSTIWQMSVLKEGEGIKELVQLQKQLKSISLLENYHKVDDNE